MIRSTTRASHQSGAGNFRKVGSWKFEVGREIYQRSEKIFDDGAESFGNEKGTFEKVEEIKKKPKG